MNYKEKALFCDQLSMVLESGISLSDGLSAFSLDFKKLEEELNAGISLSLAIEKLGLGDEYMVSLIKVGEESGYLSESLKQLSLYYSRMADVKEKLKDVLTYPILLIVMMLVVIWVLIVKVLPIFNNVLRDIGVTISPLARHLMDLGSGLAIAGLLVLLVIVLLFSYFSLMFKGNDQKLLGNLEKMPFIRKIAHKMALAQFAFELSLLLNSGYEITSSLILCLDSCQNITIKKKIAELIDEDSLADGLLKTKIFGNIYDQLLAIGFKTGKGVEAMDKVAKDYEKEVDRDINAYLDIVEPLVVGLLCIVVGAILLSVMFPLMSILSSL